MIRTGSRIRLGSILLLAAMAAPPAWAEITVQEMEGTAQIQMEGERRWRPMKGDEVINDNDVVKTGYRSKLVLRAERINQIVIGSNSKVLINLSRSKRALPVLSITLFEGAILSKIVTNIEFTVYTTTASTSTKASTFSTVVEEKTGRSGFQVLAGDVKVRNLVLKGEVQLIPGSTSVIEANRIPSNPNPLTTTHVSILGRFFGEKYVETQIKETGVKPVKAVSAADARIKASGAVGKAPYRKPQVEKPQLKSPFDMNFVIEKIAENEAVQNRIYTRPPEPGQVFVFERMVGGDVRAGLFNETVYPFFAAKSGLKWRALEIVMELPFAPSTDGQVGAGEWNSLDAILEKLQKIQIAPSRLPFYVAAGAIQPLTLGYGLAVEDFSNNLPRAAVQRSGVQAGITLTNWTLGLVVPNLTTGDALISHLQYDDGLFSLLLAYMLDMDQTKGLHPGDAGFLQREYEFPAQKSKPLSQYEIEATWNIFYHPPVWLQMYFGFSQLLAPDEGNIGYGLIVPGISLHLHDWRLLGEVRTHNDRFVSPYYNCFWAEERARFLADSTVVTMQERLIDNHAAKGVKFQIERNLLKGSSVAFSHFRNLAAYDSAKSVRPKADANTRLLIQLSSEAVRRIRSLSLYFDRYHAGYFEGGLLDPAHQSRAGLMAEILLGKWQLDLGARTYFLDTNGQYSGESMERMTDVTLGFKKHF